MYRVTTPTHTFKLPIDTGDCSAIVLTYKQGNVTLTKKYENGVVPSGMTLDEDQVIQILTQDETKKFKKGFANVQIRVLTNSGKSYASQMFSTAVTDVLNEEIL